MTGGLMQLVAYGAQDIYLTGNPMITYFKVVYRRHTNFAMESIEQTFNGTANFGNKVSALISRNGDLINGVYVQATLPDIQEKSKAYADVTGNNAEPTTGPNKRYTRWVDHVGHHLIKQVDVEIGGQLIDRQYGDWLEIWSQLTVPAGQMVGYLKMIGQDPLTTLGQNTGLQADVYTGPVAAGGANQLKFTAITNKIVGREVYVPLQFWFCRNVGLALPLIALQYHEVKINLEFRTLNELLMCYDDAAGWATSQTAIDVAVDTVSPLSASLWVDYIYLDTDERRRFAQVSHEYLIEQLQFTGDESATVAATNVTSKTANIKINFNHPVKELVWVSKAFEYAKEWANYTDTGLPAIPPFTGVSAVTTGDSVVGVTGLPQDDMFGNYTDANPPPVVAGQSLSAVNSLLLVDRLTNYNCVRPIGRPVTGNDAQPTALAGNPIVSAKLQLNGHDRFAERPGSYFNLVQTKNHHTNVPASPGINVYSFALKPEDHQPSGTCNFSRIDNATLSLKIGRLYRNNGTADALATDTSTIVRVYAVNYNVLRIMSGMGGLAYSN